MNILICTPGRLLQHLDETVGFDASTLQVHRTPATPITTIAPALSIILPPKPPLDQVLVLDEADRILDMGFDRELRAIVQVRGAQGGGGGGRKGGEAGKDYRHLAV